MQTTTIEPKVREITTGLKFPEGPVAMPDGSIILVEIARQTLTRVTPDGKQHVIRGSSWAHGTVTELRLSFRDYNNGPRDDVGFPRTDGVPYRERTNLRGMRGRVQRDRPGSTDRHDANVVAIDQRVLLPEVNRGDQILDTLPQQRSPDVHRQHRRAKGVVEIPAPLLAIGRFAVAAQVNG